MTKNLQQARRVAAAIVAALQATGYRISRELLVGINRIARHKGAPPSPERPVRQSGRTFRAPDLITPDLEGAYSGKRTSKATRRESNTSNGDLRHFKVLA